MIQTSFVPFTGTQISLYPRQSAAQKYGFMLYFAIQNP
jgi:hypothetical protein